MGARPWEWSDLETFLATARAGTLAAAAVELGVDASTVQRRIGKLETTMRVRLFSRSQRGYALTEAGQDLHVHALAMEEQAVTAWRKVGARDEQPIGTVRVATVDDFAVLILPAIVASFRERHPNVTVLVDVRTSFVDLARHEADVAIRFGIKRMLAGDVVARRVCGVAVDLCASRAYVKKHGAPATPEALAEHALVRGDAAFADTPMERILERHGSARNVALRANSFFARVAAIRAGVGIGFAPSFITTGDKTLQRLDLAFPEPQPAADLLVLVHVDMRKNARVRAFVDHVSTQLLAQRALFEGT
ncbi:MAG TPA: LysR substrate-binding domain-containing protein [Nannocystaceae bacterium]|nr:LysR substrate-binding domain-containing protein [Nannocystaceae bacterium]